MPNKTEEAGIGGCRYFCRMARLVCVVVCASLVFRAAGQSSTPQAARGANPTIILQRPSETTTPGPGPNRLDAATSESYRFGLGDVVGVAISFQPVTPVDSQPIRPRDVLGVAYHFAPPDPHEPYLIQPFDEVYLQFRYSPELSRLYSAQADDRLNILSRPYVVQPEGNILLPGINRLLHVQDQNTSQVRHLVEQAYRETLTDPEVLVSIAPARALEKSLEETLNRFQGSNFTLVIPDDQRISLPLIQELETRNKNVREVGRELTERYRALGYRRLTVNTWFINIADERHQQLRDFFIKEPFLRVDVNQSGRITLPMLEPYAIVGKTPAIVGRELTESYRNRELDRVQVSIWVETQRSRVVRVMGEVNLPGVYSIYGQADLWGMVAMAGGFTPRADTAHVRVIPTATGRRHGMAEGAYDFNDFLKNQGGATNPLLGGDEFIYVPPAE